jgi:hypothetical protein
MSSDSAISLEPAAQRCGVECLSVQQKPKVAAWQSGSDELISLKFVSVGRTVTRVPERGHTVTSLYGPTRTAYWIRGESSLYIRLRSNLRSAFLPIGKAEGQ